MRSPTDNRTLRKPVASFNSDHFSAKRGNAEAGDEDMNSLELKGDSEGLFNSPCDAKVSTSSIIANLSQKPRSFAGAWKPVIDGRIQLSTDPSSNNSNWSSDVSKSTAWNSPMRSPTASTSPRQQHDESEKPTVSNVSSDFKKDDDGNDSDSEFRRVPEMPEKGKAQSQKSNTGGSSSRKRSGASNDKEGKRLKRLLRNRVSAQQARERKKAYLIELEHKAKKLEMRNAELEEKTATLQRENYMLRQIVKNTTMLNKGSSE